MLCCQKDLLKLNDVGVVAAQPLIQNLSACCLDAACNQHILILQLHCCWLSYFCVHHGQNILQVQVKQLDFVVVCMATSSTDASQQVNGQNMHHTQPAEGLTFLKVGMSVLRQC